MFKGGTIMFDDLLEALNDTGIPFTAYRWDTAPASPYGTAQLEGAGDTVAGDNAIQEQAIRGSVDLYAPDEDMLYPETVQGVLNEMVAWRLNSTQVESSPRLIHYEWVFELEGF